MNPAKLTAQVRSRGKWEAVDLGFRLTFSQPGEIYKPWLTTYALVLLVLFAFLFAVPNILLFTIWLIKPVLDRVPLFIFSRKLFGETPTTRQTIKELPGLLKQPWLGDITWRRLSLMRSFLLPVKMLELQTGTPAKKRAQVLKTGGYDFAGWITFLFWFLESIILAPGLLALVEVFVPTGIESTLINTYFLGEIPYLSLVTYAVIVGFLEPAYVAAGFSLYLNRRTELEAWDIELSFRKLAAKIKKAAVLLVFLIPFYSPSPARAQDQDAVPKADQYIEEILADGDFGSTEMREKWVPKKGNQNREAGNFSPKSFQFLSTLIKYAVIGLAVVLFIWFLARYLQRYSGPNISPRERAAIERETLAEASHLIRPEVLPEHIVETATKLWREGRPREALSLLYRGLLAQLQDHHDISFSKNATEFECIASIRRKLKDGDLLDYSTSLTKTWLLGAYAHRFPSNDHFEEICRNWQRHLEARVIV